MVRKRPNLRKPANCWLKFPPELLIEVLTRLPVKTLMKFRCVSKEWKSLIDSPEFASLHLINYNNNNNRQNERLFLIDSDYYLRYCSIRSSESFKQATEFVLWPNDSGVIRVEGYAYGLILFSKLCGGEISGFTIWNPSIRKSKEIPPPSLLYDSNKVLLRLICDISGAENDYKVVVIPLEHPLWGEIDPPSDNQRNPSYVSIEVYSFSTGSWRSCGVGSKCPWRLTFSHTTPFLNGAMHWIGCDGTVTSSSTSPGSHIVAFDVQNEVLDYFNLPDWMGFVCPRALAVLGESLAFVDFKLVSPVVWVMEQYGEAGSWVKRFTINLEHERFLYFKRNGELLVTVKRKKLKRYDIKSQEIKDVGRTYRNQLIFMDTFAESLVLFKNDEQSTKS